jgi:hypothetical protein
MPMPNGTSNPYQSTNPYKLRRMTIHWNHDRIWKLATELVKTKCQLHDNREDSFTAEFAAKHQKPNMDLGGDAREILTDVNCEKLVSIKIVKNNLFGIERMDFVHEDNNVQVLEVNTDYLLEQFRRRCLKKFLKNSKEIKDIEADQANLKKKSSQQAKIELKQCDANKERIIEKQLAKDRAEEKELLESSTQIYEVRQEITPGNYLEFNFFPLDIKFNKHNLDCFNPGDLNRKNPEPPREVEPESEPFEPEMNDVKSEDSDDVEVHCLGKEKDGLRLTFFVKYWTGWLHVENKSIDWTGAKQGPNWHMFAEDVEGGWVENEHVNSRLNGVGKLIKDIFPNGQLVGNPQFPDIQGYDSAPVYGEFTVFTLGMMPNPEQPLTLFSNRAKGSSRWPNIATLYNRIVEMIIPMVLKAEALEITQSLFFQDHGYNFEGAPQYPFSEPVEEAPLEFKGKSPHSTMNITGASLATTYKLKPGYNDPFSKVSDTTLRVCANAGCGKSFHHSDQLDGNPCRSHPGYWDFGHTGISIQQAYKEYEKRFKLAIDEDAMTEIQIRKFEQAEDEKRARNPNYRGQTSTDDLLNSLKLAEGMNTRAIAPGDLFWNKILSVRCEASYEGEDLVFTTLEGLKVFTCLDTDKLISGNYARIIMADTRSSLRTQEEQQKYVKNMTSKHYEPCAECRFPPRGTLKASHNKQQYAQCDCKHRKQVEPASVNWDRETRKVAHMVNDHIIRIDDNPIFDFVNTSKTSVLWEPHWSCCRRRFEKIGCTHRKHVGPPSSDKEPIVAPDAGYKATLKRLTREEQMVHPTLTAKEMPGYNQKHQRKQWELSAHQRAKISQLIFELSENQVPIEML